MFIFDQNSESIYSGHLHLVSDLLQALFKEAYSLQKQLMELLDMVYVDPSVDESDDILDMVIGETRKLTASNGLYNDYTKFISYCTRIVFHDT